MYSLNMRVPLPVNLWLSLKKKKPQKAKKKTNYVNVASWKINFILKLYKNGKNI